uniref:Uncharacterized protein n=1 Tax=Rhizophora mucronata TaxID=61149 RepID=A0A2P2N3N8_RHIMU
MTISATYIGACCL